MYSNKYLFDLATKLTQNSITSMDHKGSIEKLKFRCIVVPDVKINRLFRVCCRKGYLKAAKWLFGLGGEDIHVDDEHAFNSACENGHLNVAKWLYSLGYIDMDILRGIAFPICCSRGHLNVAKWLYRCANAHNPNGNGKLRGIDIHESGCDDDSDEEYICGEWAFRHSCKNGHLNVAKWLYSLGADIDDGDHYAFRHSCINGHLHVAKWLISKGAYKHGCNKYGVGAFEACCKYGRLDIAKWLFGLDPVEFSDNVKDAFLFSCEEGHLKVAKWLFGLGCFDIRSDLSVVFKYSCENGQSRVAKWLLSIDPTIINNEHSEHVRSFINKYLIQKN